MAEDFAGAGNMAAGAVTETESATARVAGNSVLSAERAETAGSPDGATVAPAGKSASAEAVAKTADTAPGESGLVNQNPGGEPSAYADFKVPDGVTLQPVLLAEFKDLAKGFGLTQEQAQGLADLGVKQAQAILGRIESERAAETAVWLEAARADKEFGGSKLNESLAVAKKAMDAFATPELKAVLDKTGLGNHPELIRAFVKAGKLLSEDALVPGGTRPGAAGAKSLAERMYPDQGRR